MSVGKHNHTIKKEITVMIVMPTAILINKTNVLFLFNFTPHSKPQNYSSNLKLLI